MFFEVVDEFKIDIDVLVMIEGEGVDETAGNDFGANFDNANEKYGQKRRKKKHLFDEKGGAIEAFSMTEDINAGIVTDAGVYNDFWQKTQRAKDLENIQEDYQYSAYG